MAGGGFGSCQQTGACGTQQVYYNPNAGTYYQETSSGATQPISAPPQFQPAPGPSNAQDSITSMQPPISPPASGSLRGLQDLMSSLGLGMPGGGGSIDTSQLPQAAETTTTGTGGGLNPVVLILLLVAGALFFYWRYKHKHAGEHK